MAFVQFFLKTLRKQVWYNKKHKEYAMNYSRYNLSGMAELYVYRTFIKEGDSVKENKRVEAGVKAVKSGNFWQWNHKNGTKWRLILEVFSAISKNIFQSLYRDTI